MQAARLKTFKAALFVACQRYLHNSYASSIIFRSQMREDASLVSRVHENGDDEDDGDDVDGEVPLLNGCGPFLFPRSYSSATAVLTQAES